MLLSGLVLSPGPDITDELAPEAAVGAPGEAVLLQSSELVEDVDVGVIGTAVVLLPEHAFDLFIFLGFRFLV